MAAAKAPKRSTQKNMHIPRRISLRQINDVLFGVIVLINLYIITAPLLPLVTFWWQSHHTDKQAILAGQLHRNTRTPITAVATPNGLVIPAMLLDQPTLEGPENNWSDLLKQGIWRWPGSSTPDKGGNTVFLAHRFSYTGPHGAFYYLDKLKVGNEIGVIWNSKTYTYRVTSTTEVPPTDTTIENNTAQAQITLFTCTPLWHPVNRLVVVAKLETNS
ncbi:MAG TPA: class E sortase [Candidatus Saccharimonadales bacterium]|nr:class E sortase [Candidatus Saccharimonadales bacterium]